MYRVTADHAEKEFLSMIKQVSEQDEPILIGDNQTGYHAVLLSQNDWDRIQETLFLETTGTMEKVRKREKESSGFVNIDDINWDR
ncbi:type II toxin-antitoxin system Phd/YefM family antitoxin [Staphylococcus delphini]|uniref:type II toxin-antitoxin system Phd/YefM family antitoxin n=1 Tax=Staphylococcus delphini TaxID=53344 RepID=UPI001CCC56F7|nr:prevent-host-death protein [Staphylococcus delphini]